MLEHSGHGVLSRSADGKPFSYGCVRAPAICNYTLHLKKPFVVPDLAEDATFRYIADMSATRFYAGVPLVTADNLVLGTLSVMDLQPRRDFDTTATDNDDQVSSKMAQLQHFGFLVQQEIMDWYAVHKAERLHRSHSKLLMTTNKSQPPRGGEVTIVRTSVEGAASLWKRDPSAMQAALDVQDNILQKQLQMHDGYEVSSTEEGGFCLAFHDPLDAMQFALDCQMLLYEAQWPPEIHVLPGAALNEAECFRGLRVRMSIAHGRVKHNQNESTGAVTYGGFAYNVAKSLERLANGGQILALEDTWDLVVASSRRANGRFQVLDVAKQVVQMGKIVLGTGQRFSDGVMAKGVVQLIPHPLSYNYFKARKRTNTRMLAPEPDMNIIMGRMFPPLDVASNRLLCPSFHDAPHDDNQVTLMVMDSTLLAEGLSDKELQVVNARLFHMVGCLVNSFGSGAYHCKDLMVAFDGPANALCFGFMLLQKLRDWHIQGDPNKIGNRLKIGCFQGEFSSMGPHKRTGRAVYIGKVVDRAVNVAGAAAPGTICFGTIVAPGAPIWVLEFKPPSLGGDSVSSMTQSLLTRASSVASSKRHVRGLKR
ncbi:Putative serine/threonine-protein kinase/receptor [Seminavis robusta]|nr:Putative serine/threonine-protein kinase/receptor [Seminavis robusta]|eukprot:Sro366_g127680.1 Putative serine/threonine-protein kinase/receptor (593) ;mRNA; r:68915-70693